MTPKRGSLLIPLAAFTVAAGCASAPTSSEVAQTFESVSSACEVERASKLVLGRTRLAVVRTLLDLLGEDVDEEARAALRHLRRVEISSYTLGSECAAQGSTVDPVSRFLTDGWTPMVTDRGDGADRTWVMVRAVNTGPTNGLLVISTDGHELEVVRVDGRIDDLLTDAIATEPAMAAGIFSIDS